MKQLDLENTDWKEGALLLIDKPLTWTSFQAGNKIKWLLNRVKIGHSGTLDPLASGLLIFCTGKWTKKLNSLIGLSKEYTGTFTIGSTTPSFDLETEAVDFKSFEHITNEQIIEATQQFTGTIQQYPPIYSAIKQDGKRLYESARAGTEVAIKVREVVINEFEITKINLPIIEFRVACESGTYIRSLANDFGKALGVGAHLSSLRRTKIGEYLVDDALLLDDVVKILEPLKVKRH